MRTLLSTSRRAGALLAVAVVMVVGCGASDDPTTTAAADAADPSRPKRIDPATLPKPTESDLIAGYDVWMASCVVCHTRGTDGAPRVTDVKAWRPRVAKGIDSLYASAIEGFEMMPARGDDADLTDDQLRAAVDYMLFATPNPKP